MKIRLCVDRFEGDKKAIAVLLTDDGVQINLPRNFLPRGAKPGDILAVSIERDPDATKRVARETRRVQSELKETDTGGDLKL